MTTEPFRDGTAALGERVEDLLGRMTLAEKLGQLGSVWLTDLVRGDRFDADAVARRLEHGIGHVTRIGASTGLRPAARARLVNQIQQVVVERTRLGIPVIVHEESTAGYCARDATQFPQAIGLAATWDEDLVTEVADVIRRQMTAVGARHTLAPVLDVARDPRWGRVEETYGEDPYLVGRLGAAYVRGLQGDDLRHGVICTGKHFLGYAMSEGGKNHAPVHLGPRELREVYAEPFAAAIRDAGLASVMNSYASVDGLPCAGSRAVLTDLLRDELGFDGVVVADYFSVRLLRDYHRVAATLGEAGARALGAGLDLELPSSECFGTALEPLLADGRLSMEVVDTAVRRVLRSKFRLGLFERPYVEEDGVPAAFDMPSDRTLARLAAAESCVLLQNRGGVLPLEASRLGRVAVIGPASDDPRLLQGDYHYPAHAEIVFATPAREPRDAAPAASGERYLPEDGGAFEAGAHFVPHVTPLAGIRASLPGVTVVHARGCDVTGGDRSGLDEAVAAAAGSDVALLFVGGRSGLLPECTVGESRDASDLRLTGVQEDLVRAVVATGTPTVVVVVSGRVHALTAVAEVAPVVLAAWVPGEEGGNALADVLLGRSEPGGRLPLSMPRTVGQVPVHHDVRAGGAASVFWGDYTDGPTAPLWPFGHGLTYTHFSYGSLVVKEAGTTSDPVVLEVAVTNAGDRFGTEVVQLYVRDDVASVARPDQQLVGFARVGIGPGESVTVRFTVHPSRLAFFDESMAFVTEPGSFRFAAGSSSADVAAQVTVVLTGDVATFLQRTVVATEVAVVARP